MMMSRNLMDPDCFILRITKHISKPVCLLDITHSKIQTIMQEVHGKGNKSNAIVCEQKGNGPKDDFRRCEKSV